MDTTVYLGANHLGLRLRSTTATSEVRAVIDTGIQYIFQSPLDVDQSVLVDTLSKSILPAIMPINAAWILNELRIMEAAGEADIPFTDMYPQIEDALRSSLHGDEFDSSGVKSDQVTP
ncbi:hypothetical protein [Rhodococcus sp. RDE2]|uniref:hypothetical protein n=1 Tax=Rhodococcus sp. RDE2 TaxID=2885078 RepID=UPI001E58B8D6|nr:hypothetical protein [Rhodococcus sp. RDE2]